jgi:hypothetical protein
VASWCHVEVNDDFLTALKAVLRLYARPYNPRRPVVCFDEKSLQLLAHSRPDHPLQPGHPRRQDHEYVRQGTRNLFLFVEPKAGQRQVIVTRHRKKEVFAKAIRYLAEVMYPEAEQIELVLDNLNTHTVVTLIEIFGKAQADRLVSRITLHYTPRHASWLNIAEIELSAMTEQCLDRRLADDWMLWTELRAWEAPRNRKAVPIQWSFSWKCAKRMFIKDDTQAEVVQADA